MYGSMPYASSKAVTVYSTRSRSIMTQVPKTLAHRAARA